MTEQPDAPSKEQGLSIFDVCETDTSAEEDGRWFVNFFGPAAEGDIRIRGFTSKAAVNLNLRLQAKYRRYRLDNGMLPEDVSEQLVIEQISESIIADWRGPVFRDKTTGAVLPFTPANARDLLKKLPHFRIMVTRAAADLDNFRKSQQADFEKN